jgi:hypothetical protein
LNVAVGQRRKIRGDRVVSIVRKKAGSDAGYAVAFFISPKRKGEMEMKNADFKQLLVKQTPEELACWFLVTKVRHMNGQVDSKRQRQMERFVPGWTWELTANDIALFNRLSDEGKDAVRYGWMPMIGNVARGENEILYENSPIAIILGRNVVL